MPCPPRSKANREKEELEAQNGRLNSQLAAKDAEIAQLQLLRQEEERKCGVKDERLQEAAAAQEQLQARVRALEG